MSALPHTPGVAFELDGHELYAYLPGGASGGILPASLNQIPLDFDTRSPTAVSSARPPSSCSASTTGRAMRR